MLYIFLKYLATAVILSLSIPAFGLIMSGIEKIFTAIFSAIFGPKLTDFLMNRFTFIGVVHHELAHAVLAIITGAKVNKIVFFRPEGDRLGYVNYTPRGNFIFRGIQSTFSAIAPVLCGGISSLIIIYCMRSVHLAWWLWIVLIYVLFSIIVHMTMSGQDFKVMWTGYPVVLILILIVLMIVRFRIF